jgi:hypothetical protein
VGLLKKSKGVLLYRLDITWPVLKIIVDNPLEFSNLTQFAIEYNPIYTELILKVADLFGPKLKVLKMSDIFYG